MDEKSTISIGFKIEGAERGFKRLVLDVTEDTWERIRLQAVMTMQPHCKKRLIPERILPFAWEKEKKKPSIPQVDKETAKKRMEKIVRKVRF